MSDDAQQPDDRNKIDPRTTPWVTDAELIGRAGWPEKLARRTIPMEFGMTGAIAQKAGQSIAANLPWLPPQVISVELEVNRTHVETHLLNPCGLQLECLHEISAA
jgi:hypothetical protein